MRSFFVRSGFVGIAALMAVLSQVLPVAAGRGWP
jgi:hypothetical protein